jgi:predicted ATPase
MAMQIRRVILRNVRNFVDFDRTFEDPWSGRIPESLLLIGPNGSGKSTLLDVIASLWQVLGFCLRRDTELTAEEVTSLDIPEAIDLAGVEIVDLEDDPIWVLIGQEKTYKEFAATQVGSHRISPSFSYALYPLKSAEPVSYVSYWYAMPGTTVMSRVQQLSDWHQRWTQRLTENILGKRSDLPNVVYLESETRVLLPVTERFSVQPETEEFHWLKRYEPTAARKGSLYNYLYNLKVVDETAFQGIIEQANTFLVGKRLAGFDRRGEMIVEVEGRGSHSINGLSSGEKQVLLMVAAITRWLRPSGILLIDEPDLHLHPSLTTTFVGHLRRMVASKGGQLIIASHAPELWQDFTPSHRVELGSQDEVRR